MQGARGVRILGTGSAFPKRALPNAELAPRLQLTESWIVERTGIHSRLIADPANPNETCAALATRAAEAALKAANLAASEINAIFVGTMTPDFATPAVACVVQKNLGNTNAFSLDLNAACSGFVYAFATAESFLRTGRVQRALVIGADVLSRLNDWNDASTCILFGDGAGAVVLESTTPENNQVIATQLIADPAGADFLTMDHVVPGPQARPHVVMNGREVFKHSVTTLARLVSEQVAAAGLTLDQITYVVPHQANLRIIEAVAKRLGVSTERFVINIGEYGNTSAATIPTALDGAVRDGRIQTGQYIILNAFGAGFTAGIVLLKW